MRTRLLGRLEQLVDQLGDIVLARELEAELVCDLARDSLVELAEQRGRALLSTTPLAELISRARCLRTLGGSMAWRGDSRSLTEASHLLAEACGAARVLGNDVWVADALCTLGYSVHFARGEFEDAVTNGSTAGRNHQGDRGCGADPRPGVAAGNCGRDERRAEAVGQSADESS